MDNRSALLKCALELFAARGYDAVGVQEIVDAVGITKPTLYHYFGSKQGLLQVLLEENANLLSAGLREAAAYQGDLTGSLIRVAKAFFHFALAHPTYYRMQLSMWFSAVESDPFKAIAELNEQQYHLVEELFLKAAWDHGNTRGRHQAYALTFVGMLNTYITLWLNGYGEIGDDLVYRVVHQFEHGIYS
ncbi:MAG: TetR/AcrR family transcriptional regulator [Anaerolineaceae bacterium]|nr:TetR/AcrR family transcriptional regulator [Anaerolineaceae bacterium]